MKRIIDLQAKTKRLAILLTAISLLALCQAARAGLIQVADYAAEVKAPAESAALGWTYWYAINGNTTGTATLVTFNTGWDSTNNYYVISGDGRGDPWALMGGNNTGTVIPGTNNCWNVARWTSDETSSWLNVAGTIKKQMNDTLSPLDFYIRLNGSDLYSLRLASPTDVTIHPYSIDIPNVKAGDIIDLLFRAEGNNGGSELKVSSIFTIPEPASIMLVSLAGLLMAQRRRRR